jgi:tetratricopeptide (TPR) repeat protein
MKKIKKFKRKDKRHFIAVFDEEIEMQLNDALGLIEAGDIDRAESIISKLMTQYPTYHTVQYGMGLIHAFKEQYDEAISCFQKALEIFPYFLEAQFNMAVAYQKKLDFTNAIKTYQKVVEMGGDNELVRPAQDFLSGAEKSVRGTHGIGLKEYLKGSDFFNEAFDYMQKEDWEKAIVCFKSCLNIIKNHYQSYGNMGLCYMKLGQGEKAISALDRAIEIKPDYELAIINRMLLVEHGYDERISDVQIETVNYTTDYEMKKKSYIAEITDQFRKGKH